MRITAPLLRAENNNFTLVRLVLATSVIYTHCYGTTYGGPDRDDITWLLGAPISKFAVDGFFFLSGFLVYPSLIRLGKVWRFLIARFARLWPGLALSVLLTVAGGLFFTETSGLSYFRGPTSHFILGNLTFVKAFYTLTHVHCNGDVCNVNASLWTLPWEVRCYLLLSLLSILGLARSRWFLAIVLPLTAILVVTWDFESVRDYTTEHAGFGSEYLIEIVHRLWPLFAMGVAAYIVRNRLVLSWWWLAALFIFCICTSDMAFAEQSRALFEGYGVLCFGLLSAKGRSVSGHWPDYSYGIYIYAAPIMMLMNGWLRPTSHWPLAAATFVATLPLAAASWHCVEKPALDFMKRRLSSPHRPEGKAETIKAT
jgi:peptidoglycan/LPS O-acetylase OafA/YrhL